jgi:hypothetical protein
LTGGYYWFPIPDINSLTWSVLTCHELGCDGDVGHVDFWTLVIDRLATVWRKDRLVLRRHLKNHYTGLPRGRITEVGNRFMIFQGNDAPVSDWIPMVVRKFDLNRRFVKVCFDEHERMLPDDCSRVNKIFGLESGRGKIDKHL